MFSKHELRRRPVPSTYVSTKLTVWAASGFINLYVYVVRSSCDKLGQLLIGASHHVAVAAFTTPNTHKDIPTLITLHVSQTVFSKLHKSWQATTHLLANFSTAFCQTLSCRR